jgi:tetratricopeptide (TPR) repeat protein
MDNGNFDLALKQADTLESYIINHNKAFKDECKSLAIVTFARATALVNRGKMNAITGNKAQAMQDLEIAKGLTDKVIDEFEKQYGEVGDYTMAANKLMLNIQ